MTSHAGGGCLCGAVRYAVRRQPLRVTFCHCRFCQRATGAAYMVQPIFEAADFTLTQGDPRIWEQASAGSGKAVMVHFCATCGTKLFLTFERFMGMVGVYGGTFDDPNWFDIHPDTAKHIFLDSARRGTVVPAGIKCFHAHAMTNDGAPQDPVIHSEPRQL